MIWRAAPVATLCRAALLTLLAATYGVAPAAAQLARVMTSPPDAPKLLVVPFARDSADSAMAVGIPDGLRERMRLSRSQAFNVIPKAGMNEALVASGFPQDMPLEPSVARQLARFLNVRILVEGNVLRRGDSMLVIARLAETSGLAPQSATASVMAARARANGSIGSDLANRLADAYRSFEQVTNCRRAVDSLASARSTADSTRFFTRAQQAADRALQQYQQSAGAHLCVALIRRAQGAPSDSVLAPLQRAELSDSLNSLVLRQLARVYEERGDTANLLHQLHHILKVELRNDTLRVNTARLFVQHGMADSAVALIDEGLAGSPSSVTLLNARSIALAAARRWMDAAATLAQVAEVDSANIDSLFVYRITNYYQQVPDSANLLVWTRIATHRLPQQALYWYNLANVSYARADTAGAVAAIREYVRQVPTAGRGHLVYATYLLGMNQVDSALFHATEAAAVDSTLRNSAASVWLSGGVRALQPPPNYPLAEQRLGQARSYATGRILVTASYYMGLSQVQQGLVSDTAAGNNRNCDAARRAQELWSNAEQNIIAGAAQNREQANQLLTQVIPTYKQRSDAMTRNFCR